MPAASRFWSPPADQHQTKIMPRAVTAAPPLSSVKINAIEHNFRRLKKVSCGCRLQAAANTHVRTYAYIHACAYVHTHVSAYVYTHVHSLALCVWQYASKGLQHVRQSSGKRTARWRSLVLRAKRVVAQLEAQLGDNAAALASSGPAPTHQTPSIWYSRTSVGTFLYARMYLGIHMDAHIHECIYTCTSQA